MKNSLFKFTYLALAIFAMTTACISTKKAATTADRSTQKKKTAEVVSAKPASESTTKESTPKVKEPTAASKPSIVDNVIREEKKSDVYYPLPSATVSSAFKTSFPTAQGVVWVKENLLSKEMSGNGYKASFIIMDNKNTAIYSENGQLLEAREQILPEQLPPNIYNAIKNKYPNGTIVSATSVKYSVVKATYSAIIRAHPEAAYTEVKLSELGEFVK